MAVEKMKKVLIVGLSDDFSRLSKKLQRMSMLHIDAVEAVEGLEQGLGGDVLNEADAKLARISSSLDFLRKHNPIKRGMLNAKPELGVDELTANELDDEMQICEKAEACEEALAKLRTRETQLLNIQSQIAPYLALDVRVDSLSEGDKVQYFIGSIPDENMGNFREQVLAAGAVEKGLGGADNEHTMFIAVHQDDAEAVLEAMRECDFNRAHLPIDGIPKEEDRAILDELAELRAERSKLEQEAHDIGNNIPQLEMAFDIANVEKNRLSLIENAGLTDKAFVLSGWVRERHTQKLESDLTALCPDLMIEFSDAGEDETPPTALKNSKLFRPYEAVTDMYSTPLYTELDPTVIMAPFFFCFFGMMVSDAGYGILLTLGALFMMKKMRPTGMMGQIISIVAMGGISTLIWGAIYGGWFGVEFFPPLWFAPLDDPLKMIILCIVMGFIHIVTGMLVNAYQLIKNGDVISAICDVGFVLMTIIGGPLIILLPEVAAMKYIALVGILGIFLTAGRDRKGFFGKFVGGFSAVYDLTGYLSDVLSYTRLFGMGVATGVIAMVFNTIAGMVMTGPIGYVFGVLILIVGHVFNIGINAMGAYVHSCRLQYIEYYGKFFEGGGRAFVPFGYKTKYIHVKEEA